MKLILIYLLAASSFAAAQFITPEWRGSTDTEHAEWDIFTSASEVNTPDVASDTPSNDASLLCTTPSSFLTSSGNIYNFQSATSFQIDDSSNYSIRSIFIQINTLGTALDTETARLIPPDAEGPDDILYPVNIYTLSEETLGGEFGGTGVTYAIQWDLSDHPITAGGTYSILFSSVSSSMSLDKVSLDTSSTFETVANPTPLPTPSITQEGDQIILTWPATTEATLESTTDLGSLDSWSESNATIVTENELNKVTFPITSSPTFFRLRQ